MTAFSIVSYTSCNTYFHRAFALFISVLALAMNDLAGQESGHRNQSDDPVVHAEKTQHGELQGSSSMLIHRIVYGSCIKQNQPMPIFREMLEKKPDLALLIGDNIYGDSEDMSVIRSKYQMLRSNSDYARFEDSVPILATWDDHDYGQNDGGADFLQRHNSQKEFLSFWNVPRQSVRWQREGVYHSKIYGEAGHRLQVILLDTRFFRSPLRKGETRRVAGPYVPDEDPAKTMLGDSQWKWLDEQLRVPAEVRLIVSSIQCIAEAAGQETWSNLPHERQRLFDLLRSTGANGVILLSGDRHWSELSVLEKELDYPLYELTSSSLNQKHPRGTPSENRFRAQDLTYHEENFGLIDLDWSSSNPQVRLRLVDAQGNVLLTQSLKF